MPEPILAGNWKMNFTEKEAVSLVRQLIWGNRGTPAGEMVIFPPFTSLSQLHKLLISSPIQLGAQDLSPHPEGTHTGEISARMVAEFCTYVIVGHSERRILYQETDELINRKLKAALDVHLTPILCVGELQEEKQAGKTGHVIQRQLQQDLNGIFLDDPRRLVIAYEPVWAIGSGKSASPEVVGEVITRWIRPTLAANWGEAVAREIRVLYGGSVNPGNARSFFHRQEIDGGLIGGASLRADSFLEIRESIRG